MAIVSPSILSADFGKLGADCRMVLDAGAQMLHYDVMDGHFVPNISFGVPVLKSLHKNLPDAFYDVHLMISHPLQYAEAFIKAGATLYNFHLECEDDIQATIDAVRALGCKVGLTIKPGTAPQALAPYLDQLDLVLVMSVERLRRAEVHALGAGQAALAQGRARGTRRTLPAGSGRRCGQHHCAPVRGSGCRYSGGGQCGVRCSRPCCSGAAPRQPLTLERKTIYG